MAAGAVHFDTTGAVLRALVTGADDTVLAVIAGVEGPSYRGVGAMMAVLGPDDWVGSLSSGCVEADIALQAQRALVDNLPRMVRYGRGSDFIDIQLPCGGGIDVLLVPRPDCDLLKEVMRRQGARLRSVLEIDVKTGTMALAEGPHVLRSAAVLPVTIAPDLQFFVFGKGPEASAFAALVHTLGYSALAFAPDHDTRRAAAQAGCEVRSLVEASFPEGLGADAKTAVALFFHDHDWEPSLLAGALATDAFYIGAQGSRGARRARDAALRELGVAAQAIERLHGPIGLIPSVRDPRTLAVSVLAEVLAKAQEIAD